MEIEIIKRLTGANDKEIILHDDGFISRGYVIDNGKIVFKFPKTKDAKYGYEAKVLRFLSGFDFDINLQKVGWENDKDEYLGLYGVPGVQIGNLDLTDARKEKIGRNLGRFLKQLHALRMPDAFRLTLADEIKGWQERYLGLDDITAKKYFTDDEKQKFDYLMLELIPKKLNSLGERLVFSHGDLGDGNILIDPNEKLGIIDFSSGGYFDQAADFQDISDKTILHFMLDEYGADESLREKIRIKRAARPLFVFKQYAVRGDDYIIEKLISDARESINMIARNEWNDK